jgi:hypothetical protein
LSGGNRLCDALCGRIGVLLRDKEAELGRTLKAEKLRDLEGIGVSAETIRQMLVQLVLWNPRTWRARRVSQVRERRGRFGELIQIEGSPHDRFEGRAPRCTLIVFIDDATSRLTGFGSSRPIRPAAIWKRYAATRRSTAWRRRFPQTGTGFSGARYFNQSK